MQNTNFNTRTLIETALLSALVVVIMLLNAYVPLFSIVGLYILPIPITIVYIRHGLKATLLAIITSGIIGIITSDPLTVIMNLATYGLAGATLGYCIKCNFKSTKTLFLLTAAFAIGIVIFFGINIFLLTKGGPSGAVNMLSKTLKSMVDTMQSTYASMGISKDKIDTMLKPFTYLTADLIITMIPGLLFCTSFVMAYINYIITKSVLNKLRYEVNELTPFSMVYVNNRVGAMCITVYFIGVILKARNIAVGNYIINSATIIIQYTFIVDGLALATYYLRNKLKISKKITLIILILTVLSQVSIFYFYVGLVDMIIDFRRIDPERFFKRFTGDKNGK
jgi:uncharacterized protein YybS (DUF2232 family)